MGNKKWEVPPEIEEKAPDMVGYLAYTLERARIAAVTLDGDRDPASDFYDVLGVGWSRLLQNPILASKYAEAVAHNVLEQAVAVLLGVAVEHGADLDEDDVTDLWLNIAGGVPPLRAWVDVLGLRDVPDLWAAAPTGVGVKDPAKLRAHAEWWLCAAKIRDGFGIEALKDVSEYGACELLDRLRGW